MHQLIKLLEKSRKLKKNYFIMIRSLRRKKFLVHSNWNAAFNLICQEDNFYRRRGLIDFLQTCYKILPSNDSYTIDSYLNSSKFLIKWGWCESFAKSEFFQVSQINLNLKFCAWMVDIKIVHGWRFLTVPITRLKKLSVFKGSQKILYVI